MSRVMQITRGLGSWNDGTRLLRPMGLCCVGNHIYICDSEGHYLKRTGATFLDTLEVVAGIGRSVWGGSEGNALNISLTSPYSIFPGNDNTLYITSVWDALLWEFNSGKLNVKMGMAGGGFVNGKLADAKMDGPSGGCFDAETNNILIVDNEDCRIRKISRHGIVSSIGTGDSISKDGNFLICSFKDPVSICRGEGGTKNRFYVTEFCNVREMAFETQTTITFAGAKTAGYSDGPRHSAKFDQLKQIVRTRDGTFFVADYGNERVRRIAPDGFVSTVAGPFSPKSAPDSDSPLKAGPFGLCLTPNGDLVFSQPKLNQLLVLRSLVKPELVEVVDASILLPPHPSISLIELKDFVQAGAGSIPGSLSMHTALIELAYPSLSTQTYAERFQHMIIEANLLLEEVMFVLFSESFHTSWTSTTAVNMFHIAKQCHLANQFRESLVVQLEAILNDTAYDELFSLLHHVEVHCKCNAKLGSIIAYSILIKMSETEINELPPNMSTFAQSCFEPELLVQLKSGTKFVRNRSKLSESHMRSRLEWLYDSTVKSRKSSSMKRKESSPLAPSLMTNFELESFGDGGKVKCHDWILYARWPYFRFLVASGGDEWSKTRKIVFPADTFNRKTLRAFVRYLYTNRVDDVVGDENIAMQLLIQSQRFNLLKLETPPIPYPGFETLVAAAYTTFDHKCAVKNCIEKYKLAKELGNDMHIFRTAVFIAENLPQLLHSPETSSQLLALGLDTLGKIWVWTNGGPNLLRSEPKVD
jgi:hypothetical protein